MQIHQQLSLEDYHLYLKESIFANSLYKLLRLIGLFMFLLVIYKYFNEGVYSASMNGLIAMAFIVFNFRWLSYFNEKRRLNRSSYVDQLLEAHEISIDGSLLKINKGEEEYSFKSEESYRLVDYPHFLVIEINEVSHFPLPKAKHKAEDLAQIKEWFNSKEEEV